MNYPHIAQLGRQAAMKQAADPLDDRVYDYFRKILDAPGAALYPPDADDQHLGHERAVRLMDDRTLTPRGEAGRAGLWSYHLDRSEVRDYLKDRERAAEETTYLQGENADLQGENANLQGENVNLQGEIDYYGSENQQLSKWLTNPRFWGGAAVGAGGLAAAYGGKKLYDWFNEDDEEELEKQGLETNKVTFRSLRAHYSWRNTRLNGFRDASATTG